MSPSVHPPRSVRVLSDAAALAAALESPRAVLFKHSTRCPVSAYVIDEVMEFAEDHPEWPVYVLEVIEQRPLSNEVEERLEVRHESPQAFVLHEGRVHWHGSHNEVTADALRRQSRLAHEPTHTTPWRASKEPPRSAR